MRFPRQEYWSGLPFLSPGDLPGQGIEPVSCNWQVSHLRSPIMYMTTAQNESQNLLVRILLSRSLSQGWSLARWTDLTISPCAHPWLACGSMSLQGFLWFLLGLNEDAHCHLTRIAGKVPVPCRQLAASLGGLGVLEVALPKHFHLLFFPTMPIWPICIPYTLWGPEACGIRF